jgi:hypothetical protein
MDSVLAILTPGLITLIAFLVGAALFGGVFIAGLVFLVDILGGWL